MSVVRNHNGRPKYTFAESKADCCCLKERCNFAEMEDVTAPIENLLPGDGIVHYYGKLIEAPESDRYLSQLLQTIDWKNDEAMMFGKHIITKRKVAWYGDEPYQYTYSRITKSALQWTLELTRLKFITEEMSGHRFNSCLLNLYHSGDEGMAWHSDAEKDLEPNGVIASLSFGAERKFCFRHKSSGVTVSVPLAHGSLLVMKGATQQHWLHRLPPAKKIRAPRVNLTFRTIVKAWDSK